jgi:hypothetical protein
LQSFKVSWVRLNIATSSLLPALESADSWCQDGHSECCIAKGSLFPHPILTSGSLSSQLLQEVETQAVLSQQKITQTQAELSAKRRDARLNQLTSNELKALSKDTKVYEGVGKM